MDFIDWEAAAGADATLQFKFLQFKFVRRRNQDNEKGMLRNAIDCTMEKQ